VKPQFACFERAGAAGWEALADAVSAAHEAGLLVIADAKRGDVPHTAATYAEGLLGLGADAATINPLTGGDALDAFVDAAEPAGAGLFGLVRTSNPGAADLFDLDAGGRPLYEHVARLEGERAERLAGSSGLSGMGAVVGATEPEHLTRVRELLPTSILLLPGVGAQGGDPAALGAAFSNHRAGAVVPASRSIAQADDPGAAAEELRAAIWAISGG
jgi:orotidine-5'-phosphate decarboxylase